MPGIAGLISTQPSDHCERLVQGMIASMRHEPFYVSGTYSAPDIGVFSAWTALNGSFADCQPILSHRGDIALIFSGECFCDEAIRAHLARHGYRVQPETASWLIPLYEEKGDSFVKELNGLFSGILIDRRRGRACLFNDRFGMERIFYHESPFGFFFASEAKALLRILPALRTFDEQGLSEFLRYGCTLDTKTLFRGIRILPGASSWWFTPASCSRQTYFARDAWESQAPLSVGQFDDALRTTLVRVIPRYFSSRRVGVSLTGGLDTRMIMAYRPQGPDLISYTFAGETGETIDARLAAEVAATCRVPHRTLRIDDAFFKEFRALAERTVYITDGYLGVCGAHEIFLNAQARALASVRVTGNFGSEVLRAVTTFKPLELADALFSYDLRRHTPEGPRCARHPVSFAAFEEIPLHLSGTVRAAQSQIGWRTPYMDNDLVALAFRAPESRRKSSLPALHAIQRRHPELGRIRTDAGMIPGSRFWSFVHYPWARLSFKLDYWYGEGMPQWLALTDNYFSRLGFRLWSPGRHKYLHYGPWFRTKLDGYVRDGVTEAASTGNHFWNRGFLHALVKDHKDGRRNYVREIDAVLTVEAITRTLLRA